MLAAVRNFWQGPASGLPASGLPASGLPGSNRGNFGADPVGVVVNDVLALSASAATQRRRHRLRSIAISDASWGSVINALEEQRVCALALLAHNSGLLELRDYQTNELEAAVEHSMSTTLILEHVLVDFARALASEGIDYRVIKGPAVARLDYSQMHLREFGDIDVLVHGHDFDATARVLERNGCVRKFREPRPGFTARFGKGACFVTPRGKEIDLHRSFVAGPYASLGDHPTLWDAPAIVQIGGLEIFALPREWRLIGASIHAVLGRRVPRLVPLLDVAEISDRLDHQSMIALADELGMSAVLARAVLTSDAILELDRSTVLHQWAFGFNANARTRRDLRSYTGERRSYAGQVRSGLRSVPGIADKVAYARDLLVPDRSYLAERDGRYIVRIRRAIRRGPQ